MHSVDLNLLLALDVLLQEGSVTSAAKRMNLSAPAMSRTLGRIRDALEDPILVRAGRQLVPTRRAEAMRGRVHELVEGGRALLTSEAPLTLRSLERRFTLRANDAFAGIVAAPLTRLIHAEAPGIILRFAPEGDEDVESLRDGRVDLDLGAVHHDAPEIRVQRLFHDRFVGVVRKGHGLCRSKITVARFAACGHVSVSRRGRALGPIDRVLEAHGFSRKVLLVVPSFYAAIAAVHGSDLVVAVPGAFAKESVRTHGVHAFPLPFDVDSFRVSQAWHPRFEADLAHRWLRGRVKQATRGFGTPS